MNNIKEISNEFNYAVGQKWLNTESGAEIHITAIDETIVSLSNGEGKLSSFDHMNKTLWNHLVKIGFYRKI